MKRTILTLCLALSLGAVAAENPLETAKAALIRGDAAEAARIYTALAADGNVKAQFNLALLYLEGAGVATDRDKARSLLQQAAALRLPEAEYHLGLMTLYGTDGITTYEAPAMQPYNTPSPPVRTYGISLINRAAAQNLLPAIENLANIYHYGIGDPADSKKAAYWYHRAATQGSADAQYALASLYLRGDGVVRNCAAARGLLEQAAAQDDAAAAHYTLATLYRTGKCVVSSPILTELQQRKASDAHARFLLHDTSGQGK